MMKCTQLYNTCLIMHTYLRCLLLKHINNINIHTMDHGQVHNIIKTTGMTVGYPLTLISRLIYKNIMHVIIS